MGALTYSKHRPILVLIHPERHLVMRPSCGKIWSSSMAKLLRAFLKLICYTTKSPFMWRLWRLMPDALRMACYRRLEAFGVSLPMCKVVRLPCGLALKAVYSGTPFPEAENMAFVAGHAGLPVPRLLDVVERSTSRPHGYILMSWIEGEPLRTWVARHSQNPPGADLLLDRVYAAMACKDTKALDEALDAAQNLPPPILDMSHGATLAEDLRQAFRKLREQPAPSSNAVAGLNNRPLTTPRCGDPHAMGPFASQTEFKTTLLTMAGGAVAHRVPELRRLAAPVLAKNHRIYFTHGDLHGDNILVKDNRLSGFIDWEHAGWYPEYWEYTMIERHTTDSPLMCQFWDAVRPFGAERYQDELALEYALWLCTGDTTVADASGDDLSCPRVTKS
ncbi:kinase-like domain-containing protein [Earliella scabrosa]|nr:kinase-like domain-containing protein [Earliella scabrosa]